MRLSKFAQFAASARNALSSREAATTQANLETINKAVSKLIATVENYSGGLLAASSISNDEAALGQDIKNAIADAKASEVVSDEEAKVIIDYILSTLQPNIAKSLEALGKKKEALASSNLQGTTLGDLKDLRDLSNQLGVALVEKAPASRKEDGEAANKKIDANFEAAIKDFS